MAKSRYPRRIAMAKGDKPSESWMANLESHVAVLRFPESQGQRLDLPEVTSPGSFIQTEISVHLVSLRSGILKLKLAWNGTGFGLL